MVVAVATLVGTPTAGALLKTTDDTHFTRLIVFSGVLTLAGTIILAAAGVVGSQRLRRFFIRGGSDGSETVREKTPEYAQESGAAA